MRFNYNNQIDEIEQKMRSFWQDKDYTDIDKNRDPYFILDMFPYPSGTGLHMGHPLGYIAGDVHGRFMKMRGYNVLRAIGFDSFGLPAEQFAIQTGQHPAKTTFNNINNMRKQLKTLALSYDWNREISTSDPKYYKITQWIFLQFYNSFFDHTEIWDDGFGHKITGRAKSIDVLANYLRTQEWHINGNGEAVPGKSLKSYTEDEIRVALDNARLAYREYIEVNWCPRLGTVLANEEINPDGTSERGNFPVEKRKMQQWMLRITKYADRLLGGFEYLDWPEQTIGMQKHWIGKSKGIEIVFKGHANDITIFTTRPDTLYGVTFIAVSQENIHYGQQLPDNLNGLFTGKYVTHPLTNEEIPVWITRYVLNTYGTGAVMGVPAHDQRDWDFAVQFNLPIKAGIMAHYSWLLQNSSVDSDDLQMLWISDPKSFNSPFTGYGHEFTDEQFAEYDVPENIIDFLKCNSPDSAMDYLEKHKLGAVKCNYRLRDWLFSRQRYWGEPFPIVYDSQGTAYQLDESELPLQLPNIVDFIPPIGSEDPLPPLARCADWIEVEGNIINGKVVTQNIDKANAKKFRREANTMPNWAGSCWYYLRYFDPKNLERIMSDEAKNYWCNGKYATVDLYIGGSEHAVLHYLYARFWHLFLFDLGHISNPEPFQRVVHQGLITANAYVDSNGLYVDIRDVEVANKIATHKNTGEKLKIIHGKMGKSYKNGIPPEDICREYTVDVFRLYLMYMAPLSQSRDWQPESIIGMERFCKKVCNIADIALRNNINESDDEIVIKLHSTIMKLTHHYETLEFNTAIAFMIEFCNSVSDNLSIADLVTFLQLLGPCAPHICEYWYQEIKQKYPNTYESISLFNMKWPNFDQNILDRQTVSVPVMINNKFKFAIDVHQSISDTDLKKMLIKSDKIDDINKYKMRIIRKERQITISLVKIEQ